MAHEQHRNDNLYGCDEVAPQLLASGVACQSHVGTSEDAVSYGEKIDGYDCWNHLCIGENKRVWECLVLTPLGYL